MSNIWEDDLDDETFKEESEYGSCKECGADLEDESGDIYCDACEAEREPIEPDYRGRYRDEWRHEAAEWLRLK